MSTHSSIPTILPWSDINNSKNINETQRYDEERVREGKKLILWLFNQWSLNKSLRTTLIFRDNNLSKYDIAHCVAIMNVDNYEGLNEEPERGIAVRKRKRSRKRDEWKKGLLLWNISERAIRKTALREN